MIAAFSSFDARIQRAIDILKEYPSQTASDLADRLGLSESRLSHLFRAEIGISVKTYLVKQRLDQGAHLLTSTEMSIKEIAYCLGYHHSSSFVRAFKTRFSMSPNHYRSHGSRDRIATLINK